MPVCAHQLYGYTIVAPDFRSKCLDKHQHELFAPIVAKLNSIIADIGKKEGFTMVMNRGEQLVLYAVTDVDITDRVISAYNRDRS